MQSFLQRFFTTNNLRLSTTFFVVNASASAMLLGASPLLAFSSSLVSTLLASVAYHALRTEMHPSDATVATKPQPEQPLSIDSFKTSLNDHKDDLFSRQWIHLIDQVDLFSIGKLPQKLAPDFDRLLNRAEALASLIDPNLHQNSHTLQARVQLRLILEQELPSSIEAFHSIPSHLQSQPDKNGITPVTQLQNVINQGLILLERIELETTQSAREALAASESYLTAKNNPTKDMDLH